MYREKALEMTEKGMLPDAVVRAGIRQLLRQRLVEIAAGDLEQVAEREQAFLALMRAGPVAESPDATPVRTAARSCTRVRAGGLGFEWRFAPGAAGFVGP